MIPDLAPFDFGPLLRLERRRLLDVLRSLEPADWTRLSPCPGWTVLGLVAHLVGDDLSYLAWQRDGHRGTVPPAGLDEASFITWIDDLQSEWVHAARRLSPALVVQLLEWTDEPMASVVMSQDPSARDALVSWAATGPVPVWLDHGRELCERWIHRQQILQSLGEASDLRFDLALPVLDSLRWAYPHRLAEVGRPAGSTVRISVAGPGMDIEWWLANDGAEWTHQDSTPTTPPIAVVSMSAEQAWRQLTNNADPNRHGRPRGTGDDTVLAVLDRTRAIIGTPK
jgi:uncharacterized protein (TIGR03083 family)